MEIWPLSKIAKIDSVTLTFLLKSMIEVRIFRKNPTLIPSDSLAEFKEKNYTDFPLSEVERNCLLAEINSLLNVCLPQSSWQAKLGAIIENLCELWERSEHLLTFKTSGSTGQAKNCLHTEDSIRHELCAIAPLCCQAQKALVTVPLEHLYGFSFGLLLPLTLHLPLSLCPPLPTLVAEALQTGLLVVSIPLLWEKLVKLTNFANFQEKQVIFFTATAPIAADALKTLCSAGFALRDIYGASEFAAMGLRTDPHGDFLLLPNWQRQGQNKLSKSYPDGHTEDFLPLDHLEWKTPRHFLVQGRIDQAIQVAGVNVYPSYVAKILQKHPLVKDCAVRLMRKDEGDRLKAFIVPTTQIDHKKLRQTLHQYAKEHLPEPACPKNYHIGTNLPKNHIGKYTDW